VAADGLRDIPRVSGGSARRAKKGLERALIRWWAPWFWLIFQEVPDWLEGILPDFMRGLVERMATPEWFVPLAVVSGLALIASLVGVPLFLARLPANHFCRPESRRSEGAGAASLGRRALRILRNALGVVLVVLGLLMLLLPGQGFLTLLAGLLLVDFPGKQRLESWILKRPSVLRAVNALRRRMGKPPFDSRESWLPPQPSQRHP
jgi:hypothetical protein